MMTEKEQLEKLLAFDSYDKAKVYQWAYDAQRILSKNFRDMSCLSALDCLIRFGRDDFFGHFEKVKFELQRLYDDKYNNV